MYKTLSTLILATVPVFAMAGGTHAAAGDANASHKGMAGMKMEADHDSAAGQAGDASKVDRTIELSMDDSMRFTPSQIPVKAGETIRFFVKNSGKVPHEMVIGSLGELKEHAAMMQKMPGMQHAEANMVTLKPGQRGGLVWKFTQAGAVDFACLIPGHMEAGMVGKVNVQ
ncbi:hypothetical protein LPB72_09880 [Hydrogenophaga crassostreae]|uniref:Blue (type 1) copper domain-containing protein n=2 Tax=Hydrogenophaga crassostreae TaxID=1763535 RepID=A0A167HRD7_9BURK|nr:cupredoxin family protein [Hydrogenophaga crassostreae]AOW13346.1 hypothetical protein LPB072_11260 [Hydrogenophaga crassostreae]OAD41629.1 hypothetical protein LPB72_09880 [Hydrogenophaga crassostreae]